jgi:hypothetical protein
VRRHASVSSSRDELPEYEHARFAVLPQSGRAWPRVGEVLTTDASHPRHRSALGRPTSEEPRNARTSSCRPGCLMDGSKQKRGPSGNARGGLASFRENGIRPRQARQRRTSYLDRYPVSGRSGQPLGIASAKPTRWSGRCMRRLPRPLDGRTRLQHSYSHGDARCARREL